MSDEPEGEVKEGIRLRLFVRPNGLLLVEDQNGRVVENMTELKAEITSEIEGHPFVRFVMTLESGF